MRWVPSDVGTRDAKIARLAARQYGHVSRQQLLALGVGSRTITAWVARGLIRVHTGVYAVGHLRGEAVAVAAAALLACGDDAVLSHATAAALWGLRPWPPVPEVSGPSQRRRPGVRHHLASTLARGDIRRHRGLRVTSPLRTLTDLEPRLTRAQFTRVLNDARLAGLLKGQELAALACDSTQRPTRSVFEDAFLAELQRRGLPEPEPGATVAGFEVDFLFATERVIVELDGWAFHADRASWERDRRRDELTAAAGYTTLRITWARWRREREAVLASLVAVLAARGWRPAPAGRFRRGASLARQGSYGLLPWF